MPPSSPRRRACAARALRRAALAERRAAGPGARAGSTRRRAFDVTARHQRLEGGRLVPPAGGRAGASLAAHPQRRAEAAARTAERPLLPSPLGGGGAAVRPERGSPRSRTRARCGRHRSLPGREAAGSPGERSRPLKGRESAFLTSRREARQGLTIRNSHRDVDANGRVGVLEKAGTRRPADGASARRSRARGCHRGGPRGRRRVARSPMRIRVSSDRGRMPCRTQRASSRSATRRR